LRAGEDWATALEISTGRCVLTRRTFGAEPEGDVLRKLGEATQAGFALQETLQLDPLDWWASILNSKNPLDLQAHSTSPTTSPGWFPGRAIELLAGAVRPRVICRTKAGARCPLVYYTLGWLQETGR